MAIQNMPTALQAAIQTGFLEREFKEGLTSALAYRDIADKEPVAINAGESVTKTRAGLKAPITAYTTPSSNTNLDNGMSPTSTTIEQYTLSIGMLNDTTDLNIVTSQVGIANQFLLNARVNGIQARQSLDRVARNTLFSAYLGGQTRVRTTAGTTTLTVDDVRGFETVVTSGGVVTAVSAGNPATVIIGANSYTLQGTTRDGSNVSTTPGGFSGTITLSASAAADNTAGNRVVHANAPVIVRPGGKWTGGSAYGATTSTLSLTSTEVLTLGAIEDAIAQLRNNTAIQDELNLYLDNVSMRQLFADSDFKLMYQGQYGSATIQQGKVFQLIGANFIPTTEALTQVHPNNAALTIHRPILVAQGALIEGDFAGLHDRAADLSGMNSEVQVIDGVAQVVRGPLDRLAQIVAQSWFWIGGFAAPTDVTANSTIIPTAGAQYYKRAVVIEHI